MNNGKLLPSRTRDLNCRMNLRVIYFLSLSLEGNSVFEFFVDRSSYQGILCIHISLMGSKKLCGNLPFYWCTTIVDVHCILWPWMFIDVVGVRGWGGAGVTVGKKPKLYACLLCFAEQMRGWFIIYRVVCGRVKLNSRHWNIEALFKNEKKMGHLNFFIADTNWCVVEFCARVGQWQAGGWVGLDNISGLFIWLLYLPILFFVLWFVILCCFFWTENMM